VFGAAHADDAVSLADFLNAIWSARSMLLAQDASWTSALPGEAGSEQSR
jgi:hypothetical protein